jgi:hypothetical protein
MPAPDTMLHDSMAPRDQTERFVLLATLGDPASARLCAALLESEGIEARVHSESFGPYPMTVGEMATARVWVPESRVSQAQQIMVEAEIAHVLGGVGDDRERDTGRGGPGPGAAAWRLVALTVAVIVLILAARALLRVF